MDLIVYFIKDIESLDDYKLIDTPFPEISDRVYNNPIILHIDISYEVSRQDEIFCIEPSVTADSCIIQISIVVDEIDDDDIEEFE